MSYDRRTASLFDQKLARAVSRAKAHWGSGWANLTPNMQNAYVCQGVVAELGSMDWDHLDSADPEVQKVVDRLKAISELCLDATRS